MTTATYLVLLYGDEDVWRARDAAALEVLDASHRTFREKADAQGHAVLDGRELDYASTSRVVRRSRDGVPTLSDGPFAETVEQLGGYYVVRTADPQGLADLLADALTEDADIRPVRGSDG